MLIATLLPRDVDFFILYVAASRLGFALLALDAPTESAGPAEKTEAASRNAELLQIARPVLLIHARDRSYFGSLQAACRLRDCASFASVEISSGCTLAESEVSSVPTLACLRYPSGALCLCQTGGTTAGGTKLAVCTHEMALSEIHNYPGVVQQKGIFGLCSETSSRQARHRVLQPSPIQWQAAVFGQFNLSLALAGTLVITDLVAELSARECRGGLFGVLGELPWEAAS